MAMIEVFWPKFEKIAPTQTHKIPVVYQHTFQTCSNVEWWLHGDSSLSSIYYYSTSTIVIIWLEIGLRGRNAIWNFGMENCHLWAYSLPSLVDIISHHYQRSAVWMYPLVLYKEPVGRFFIVVCNGVDLGAVWWKQIWAEREWVFYVTSSWRHGVWTQIFLRIQHIYGTKDHHRNYYSPEV